MSQLGSSAGTAGRASTGGDGGFFSSIKSGIGEGLGAVARDLLPVWTARELKLQQVNQLGQPTFVSLDDVPRIDDKLQTTGDSPNQTTDVKIGGFTTNLTQIALVGAGLLGVVFIVTAIARR